MDKRMRIKQGYVAPQGAPYNPGQFSQPVQEMLATESPEQLQEVLERHGGVQVTPEEVTALKKHGVSIHLKTCYGAECREDQEVTPDDIRLAISQCAEKHANAMDEFFEEVPDEPVEGESEIGTPAEGE